jgi:predicted dehydrogenase
MKKHYSQLPTLDNPAKTGGHVGLIGCGNFAFSTIAYYLNKNYGHVVRAAMDTDIHKAASLFDEYALRYYTDHSEKIITDPEIDLIYIASNHATHPEYAIQVLSAGKHVHIEKPHVVSQNQLLRLAQAMNASQCKVVGLGFNRPYSRIGKTIKSYLDSQTGPSMLNWFVVGHELPTDHWYLKPEEGGRVLGNLCHWTDFIYQMVAPENRYPITIKPTRWGKSDCDIVVTFIFGDGTIAAITFCDAKGHMFEGVRERFAAHRGNVLISMDDFQSLTVEVVDRKHKISQWTRDHGHEQAIKQSYENARSPQPDQGCSVHYVWETGELFLMTKEALETNKTVVVHPFDMTRLNQEPAGNDI